MNLKKLLQTKYILVVLTVSLYACGGSKEGKNDNADTGKDTAKNIVNDIKEQNKKVLTKIPEPSEIPYMIKQTGAEFDPKLANSPASSDKYKTTNSKAALNLGVYATDLGYMVIYDKVQNAIDYMNATQGLADKLGIAGAFSPATVKRFKDNLSSIDSLTKIINESMKKSDDYLKSEERNDIAALIFTGSFLEGLFVATELVANYPKDELPEEARIQVLVGLVREVIKQKVPLGELIKALKSLNDKPADVNKLVTDLEELYKIYEDLNMEEKIRKNKGDLILSDKSLIGITKKVNAIRADIVN
ncbi:hypothetical protein [Microscilla marina]|uniref:Lipoprotein, putative n=1 Tax=Microscilla marina ATCC 23134 TaxID=313606 RepID=A1ZGU5_MICM2|nr:hypothetical protein [Microscilla marina]EAY30214.1 lipoprotein, putative [Microscilla marina ATCC 23134]